MCDLLCHNEKIYTYMYVFKRLSFCFISSNQRERERYQVSVVPYDGLFMAHPEPNPGAKAWSQENTSVRCVRRLSVESALLGDFHLLPHSVHLLLSG